MKKKNIPTVGIALLAYNYGQYIDDVIDSFKKQTFQDFEIYLLDDGSNDGFTPEKLQKLDYAKINKKLLYKENIGNAERRRRQYRIMNNKYILDMSADDRLAPTFLEKTVDYLEKHPECGAVSTNMISFYDDKKIPSVEVKYNTKNMNLEYILGRNHMLGSSLMRKEALVQADLSGRFVRYQDWDRWISILESGWKLGLVEEPLFYYRQHQNSLSHSASVEDEMEIRREILKKHAESYKKYYEQVILNVYRNLLEVQEGKNWLERQYHNLNIEVRRLNNIIDEKNKKIDLMLSNRVKRFLRKLKCKVLK